MELEYRFADIDELDFLVRMRIRDLRMFSECAAGTKLEDAIRRFYEIKMKENACRTLLAYAGRELAATATLYFYDVLPSNENPSGRVGQTSGHCHPHGGEADGGGQGRDQNGVPQFLRTGTWYV